MTSQRRQVQRRTPPQPAAPAAVAVLPGEPVVEPELVDDTPQPQTATPVVMRISPDMLRQLLRLRREVAITDAIRDPETGLIEFTLTSPAAPPDATELLVTYRHTGGQDPIHAVSTWSTT